MADQTPSAGPAPVTFTAERYRELLDQAAGMAQGPSLLLPTVEHVQALYHALRQALKARSDAATVLVALLLDANSAGVTIPTPYLAEIAASGAGLVLVGDPKETRVSVAVPPQPKGKPS